MNSSLPWLLITSLRTLRLMTEQLLMQKQIEIPSWATDVVSGIERRRSGITYLVLLEGAGPCDVRISITVWKKEVRFGTSESRHAGCYAFQEASKEQDRLAAQYTAHLGGNMTEEYINAGI